MSMFPLKTAKNHLLFPIRHHGLDGVKRVSFQAVVDVDEGFPPRGRFALADQGGSGLARLGVDFLGLVVGLKGFHGVLVFPAGLEEKPCGDQFRVGPAAGKSHLVTNLRHLCPGIVHMRDPVAGKAVEVFLLEPLRVAHLDGVGPALGELGKEGVQRRNEIAALPVIGGVKAGEFKNEEADPRADPLAWLEESALKNIRFEEIGVRLARPLSKARQVGKSPHRNFVGDLEPELKIRRRLQGQALQVLDAGKGVISRVHAHGFENPRVFGEAVLLEARRGEFPAPFVAGAVIKLPAPARVFPGRRADKNARRGQRRCAVLQAFAVKRHRRRIRQPPPICEPRAPRSKARTSVKSVVLPAVGGRDKSGGREALSRRDIGQ